MITIVNNPKSPESLPVSDIPDGTVFWGRLDGADDEPELYLRTDESEWPLIMLSNSPGLLVYDHMADLQISGYTPVNIEIKVVP